MFIKILKRIPVLFLAVVLTTPFLSCQKKKGEDSLTVIYPTSILSVPLVAIAREKNYFTEEGLDIEYITLTSGAIEATSIGKGDIMLTGIIPTLSYAAQGADVKVIAGTLSGGNFFIAKKENAEALRNLENWKGKRLGVVRLSTSEMVSRYALQDLGIDASKDLTYVETDAYPNIIEGVRKNYTEIGAIGPEHLPIALDFGLEVVFPMTNLSPEYICCRQSAYTKSVEEKPEAFVKFLKGQIRAYKYFNEQQDDVVKILAKASSQEEDRVRVLMYNKAENGDRSFNPDPDLNRTRKVYETLKKWNYVPDSGIEAEDIVIHTLYRKALDEILEEYPDEAIYRKLSDDYAVNNL
jgi:NitT/TauT family transport system substrate-binding protein